MKNKSHQTADIRAFLLNLSSFIVIRCPRILLILFLAQSAFSAERRELALRIEGRLLYFPNGEQSFGSSLTRFELTLHQCLWKMRLIEPGSNNDYIEVSYDGTNTYYLNVLTNAVQKARDAGHEIGANVATGIVRKGPVPSFLRAHAAGPIWAAFCSGCYFAGLKDEYAEPIATERALADGAKGLSTNNVYNFFCRRGWIV
jgi:hypothetical protein